MASCQPLLQFCCRERLLLNNDDVCLVIIEVQIIVSVEHKRVHLYGVVNRPGGILTGCHRNCG